MAADFVYSPATDVLIIANGTSGSPHNFAAVHDWDVANNATLLSALIDTNLSLDYQVRPCEMGALKLTILIEDCSERGPHPHVDLTGLDSEGNAQTEEINTPNNDTNYVTTKSWKSIDANGVDCAEMDNGTITITQARVGVIWEIIECRQYRITPAVYFGDNSTATYFRSFHEKNDFDQMPRIYTNANVKMGWDLMTGYSCHSTCWCIPDGSAGSVFLYGGTLEMWGSILIVRYSNRYLNFTTGSVTFHNSKILFELGGVYLKSTLSLLEYDDLFVVGDVYIGQAPTADSDKLWIEMSHKAIIQGGVTVKGLQVTNQSGNQVDVTVSDNSVFLLDPHVAIAKAYTLANNDLLQRFTANLHVVDEDGASLTGVTVKCYDWYDSQYNLNWTRITGADGKLTVTDYIKHSYWESSTLGVPSHTYYPHKFELTKAGYVGLNLENVDISVIMNPYWRIEMSLTTADLVSAAETAINNQISLTGGKVDAVALVDVTTENTDMVGTNNAATETKQDIIGVNTDDIEALLRADKVIDTDKTPWVTDYFVEGTVINPIMSKTMKNTGGEDVTTYNHVLGRLQQE